MYRDITTYSRDAENPKEPYILENELNGIKFNVHKHAHYGDKWLLSCYELRIEKKNLRTANIEDAKRKAIIEILISLNMTVKRYNRAIEQANRQLAQLVIK